MTDQSHAVGGSSLWSNLLKRHVLQLGTHPKMDMLTPILSIEVPAIAQEKLPQGVEENVPNTIHDTGSTGSQSHATGNSKVPKAVQEAVPKKLEEVLPNKIHDTSPGGIDTRK